MDYTLTSLRDAFDDAKYKESRRDFRLYAILLATSLDQRFILEYISLFHELDVLTGKRLLVIGPQLSPHRRTSPEIRESELDDVRGLVIHHAKTNSLSSRDPTETAGRFLQFMHDQTRESYAIARFLGIRSDQLPAFVFFDSLDCPHDFVVWNLQGKTGRDFVLELRTLLENVNERCHWELGERVPELHRRVEQYRKDYFWDSDVPRELQTEWKYNRQKREELWFVNEAVQFYEKLDVLRSAYDRACSDSGLRLPLENVGHTIARLEAGLEKVPGLGKGSRRF